MTMMIRNLGFMEACDVSLMTFKFSPNLGSQVISHSRKRQILYDVS